MFIVFVFIVKREDSVCAYALTSATSIFLNGTFSSIFMWVFPLKI